MKPKLEALNVVDPKNLYTEALAIYPYMMRVGHVAEFVDQTEQAITKYLREGAMSGVKVGRYWLVPKASLIEYLYANTNTRQKSDAE